jgi:hypothetical protein
LLALLLWRLVERTLRVHGETTGKMLAGWDKKVTQKPTAFMMMTTFSAVIVLKILPLAGLPGSTFKSSRQEGAERQAQGGFSKAGSHFA